MSPSGGWSSRGPHARARTWLLAVALASALGCEVRSFPLTDEVTGGGPDAGRDGFVFIPGTGGAGGSGTGAADALPPLPDGAVRLPDGGVCVVAPEICDGEDNDCDGQTDEDFDVTSDPRHCGRCGRVCDLPRAFPGCVNGECVVRDCLPGWFNPDGRDDTGCECLRSNGGVELCDGADNDCDGMTDEDFDLRGDVRNCGQCGTICEFPRAAAMCSDGRCVMGACEPGWVDLGATGTGCRYACTPTADPTEICDGVDNDCDGGIDNSPAGEGMPCGPDVVNVGACRRGVTTCTAGRLVCLGAVEPGIEFCDGQDNDCDGLTDEGFDKLNDIRYCGNCQPCAIPNAVPRCAQGVCQLDACSPGWTDLDPAVPGCEYACTFTGMEICNGRDDDCDGMTDEGFDKQSDPNHCGACGTVCRFDNAQALCSAGQCAQGTCNPNFHDLSAQAPGCEYFCVRTGAELCDGVDNDCNGQTDEGFDRQSDVNHCGRCGNVCRFNNAAATCSAGICQRGPCEPGFVDADGQAGNGCEYRCTPSNGGVEICDGLDNDCDNLIDESDPQLDARCYPQGEAGCNVAANTCAGTCRQGRYACLGGRLSCQGFQLPRPELCDLLDNDCDGQTDEDFDKQNDPRFCGNCQTTCSYSNAVALCQAGVCRMGPCRSGWVDLDNDMNGCEYACTRTGPEVCDGQDNDCDGLTDGADPDLLYPATNFCRQIGECGRGPGGGGPRYPQNTYPVCVQLSGMTRPDWVCNYPATVQLTGPNLIVSQESWCDDLDNDCDGATDEHMPAKGQTCSDSGVGECQRTGTIACDPGNRDAPAACRYSGPASTPQHELCDDKDNDCDGHTDEVWDDPGGTRCGTVNCRGVRDAMVTVTAGGYSIFQYEASRPNATSGSQGTLATRACSVAGVRPWTSVTFAQAQAACAAAGKRLCRTNRSDCASPPALNPAQDEWGRACMLGWSCGTGNPVFPYGCTYNAQTCNGADNTMGSGGALPGGNALTACHTNDLDTATAGAQRAFDLSGNVSEWTADCGGVLPDGREIYTLRGGDFLSGYAAGVPSALQCNFYQVQVAADYSHPSTGFRCCTICAPGQAECGGSCVNLASSTAHCGGCGRTCLTGQTCSNGRCVN